MNRSSLMRCNHTHLIFLAASYPTSLLIRKLEKKLA